MRRSAGADGGWRRLRRPTWSIALVGLTVLATGGALPLALAGEAPPPDPGGAAPGGADPVALETAGGYGGLFTRGRAMPVRVTVAASHLVSGDLVARRAEGGPLVEVPVEVPGASAKRFVLVLPASLADGSSVPVDVELRSRGRTLARSTVRLRSAEGELVALSPGVRAGRPVPGPAALAVDAGVARFAALDLADLAGGAAALDPLSAVALRPEELDRLGRASRASLLSFLADGGHLLVDGEPGTQLPGLPPAWQPGPGSDRRRAGAGEVRLTGSSLADGRFAGLVEPTGRDRVRLDDPSSMVADSVARDAGLRLPHITSLLLFLGIYVATVGPGSALALRRLRRPELAWAVVPALAVVFTMAAYAGGQGTRNRTHLAHATVVELGDPVPLASTWIGLTRPDGTARLALADGWALRPASDGATATPVRQGSGGHEARMALDVGEFGLLSAEGPLAVPGGVDLLADLVDDEVRGVVRNRLPFALEEVVVVLDGRVTGVGRLAPGEERTWRLPVARAGQPAMPGQAFVEPQPFLEADPSRWFEAAPWQQDGFEDVAGKDGVVSLPLWQLMRSDPERALDAPGLAAVVGWTRDVELPLRLEGRPARPSGRTALVARAPVRAPDGRAPALAVRRDVVRGPFVDAFGGWKGGPDEATVLRFTLPEGASTDRPFELRSSVPLGPVEFWTGDRWTAVGVDPTGAGGAGAGAPPTTVPLSGLSGPSPRFALPVPVPAFPMQLTSDPVAVPPQALTSGVVFVRVTGMVFGGDGNRSSVTLGERP